MRNLDELSSELDAVSKQAEARRNSDVAAAKASLADVLAGAIAAAKSYPKHCDKELAKIFKIAERLHGQTGSASLRYLLDESNSLVHGGLNGFIEIRQRIEGTTTLQLETDPYHCQRIRGDFESRQSNFGGVSRLAARMKATVEKVLNDLRESNSGPIPSPGPTVKVIPPDRPEDRSENKSITKFSIYD